MYGWFDKPLFLGRLRPEWLSSNQVVSQQRRGISSPFFSFGFNHPWISILWLFVSVELKPCPHLTNIDNNFVGNRP